MSKIILGAILATGLISAQSTPEQFWLAGRYDGNRVIVYFDAVKFGSTAPPNPKRISAPVADGFFGPVVLPASYIAQLQKGSHATHFALGDRDDLLLGNSNVATLTLTSLVGSEGDEGTGNFSYIGALGTLEDPEALFSSKNYYAVRRHREPKPNSHQLPPHDGPIYGPVPFDIQAQAAAQLIRKMKVMAPSDLRTRFEKVSPAFEIQSFYTAAGSLRYYARSEWRSGATISVKESVYALGAWMSPQPTIHILSTEDQTSNHGLDAELPKLLNIVDLGNGKTGIIVSISGEDSEALQLREYKDGADIAPMPELQSISAGE